jgi:hypothetical protein
MVWNGGQIETIKMVAGFKGRALIPNLKIGENETSLLLE